MGGGGGGGGGVDRVVGGTSVPTQPQPSIGTTPTSTTWSGGGTTGGRPVTRSDRKPDCGTLGRGPEASGQTEVRTCHRRRRERRHPTYLGVSALTRAPHSGGDGVTRRWRLGLEDLRRGVEYSVHGSPG